MTVSVIRSLCLIAILLTLFGSSHGFLPKHQSSQYFGSRIRASQLNMKQTSYKAPWWKTAVASLGILSTVVAGGPPNSFAADTVKVIN